MASPLRFEAENSWQHVSAEGNECRDIFRDDHDGQRFVGLLGAVAGRFGVVIAAYVLMGNHYHLVLCMAEAKAADQYLFF